MRITPDSGILVRMNAKASGPARRLLGAILDRPHELVLSEFLLSETARVLRYPRMQPIYKLCNDDIAEHIRLLRARSELVDPIIHRPIIIADPDDDPVIYTAAAGRSGILCTLDRDFYASSVVSFVASTALK